MARRKQLTLEEELIKLKQEATECEDKIKELSDKKKELKGLIEKKQMEALYQATVKSGKSIDEVISMLNGSPGEYQEGALLHKKIDFVQI